MKTRYFKWAVIVPALILTLAWDRAPAGDIHHLSADQAATLIEQNRENKLFVILDLRTPPEYAQGHIAGARLLDFRSPGFRADLERLDRSKTYLIYCRTGNRTGQALKQIQTMGFDRVYHLKKGIVSWAAAKLPVVR